MRCRRDVASQNYWLWGLFFAVTRLLIGVTQGLCELKDLRAGDIILRCGCGGAIAGLIIVVTGFSAWRSRKVTAMSSLVTLMTNSFAEPSGASARPLTASYYFAEEEDLDEIAVGCRARCGSVGLN